MEALYSKLYDKYTKIKTQKESEMDKLNRDQEVKFMKYITEDVGLGKQQIKSATDTTSGQDEAADELIEHLRNENKKLHEQSDKLRSEAASIRSSRDEEKAEYQQLLKEEKQKNNQLSEEIDQLRYLQREGLCCSAREGNTKNGQLNMSGRLQVGSGRINDSDVTVTRKRSRHYGSSADITVAPYSGDQLEHAPGRESASDLSKKSLPGGTDSVVAQPECESASDLSKKTLSGGTDSAVDQPECCRRKIDLSGGESNFTGPTNCMFHDLIEFVVSMKLSTSPRSDGRSISAVHQSSGYSFSLTFVTSKAGEVELVYRVLSLGTFERVAPEWMKEEVLRFSTRMCPIFFQRVSRVIKCHR